MNITMTLVITAIALISRVEPVATYTTTISGATYTQWAVPTSTVGIAYQGNNVVLMGHTPGVLSALSKLKKDAAVQLGTDVFTVHRIMLVREKGVTIEQRIENAKWILPTEDRRITVVTCAGTRDEYRLIVVAAPA